MRDDEQTITTEKVVTAAITRGPTEGRARLVVLTGPELGRKYTLSSTTVLGRGADATIVLDDAEVSRKHALIRRADDGTFVLEDLGSRNGTLVNGVPVDRRRLVFGDKVQVGSRLVLLFTLRDPVEEQLLQRQRLEALGRLGAGIAHDFNNMLGAVLASLDYLRTQPDGRTLDDPRVRECLEDIHAAAARAAELTPRLLSFARGGSRESSPVDVSLLAAEVVQLARRTFDRSIKIVADIQPGLLVVGDRIELHQVLMNLCLNARDAMPRGGTLTIEARMATVDQLSHVPLRSLEPHVVVRVIDTGAGMDEPTRDRIFEPFFTTKPGGMGYGLGLATVHEVVTAHGGHVEAQSELGQGSTFLVYLPTGTPRRAQKAIATIDRRAEPLRPARVGGAIVLLVDDEEIVRRATARLLRQAGHEVVEARDGVEALEVWGKADPKPDLVLLDLDMPNMAGDEAQRRLRAESPEVRILFVTGHGDESRELALREEGALGFLRKPCHARVLLDEVERILSST